MENFVFFHFVTQFMVLQQKATQVSHHIYNVLTLKPSIFFAQSYVDVMFVQEGLGRGYVEFRLMPCRGVRTRKIGFNIIITMMIRSGLALVYG